LRTPFWIHRSKNPKDSGVVLFCGYFFFFFFYPPAGPGPPQAGRQVLGFFLPSFPPRRNGVFFLRRSTRVALYGMAIFFSKAILLYETPLHPFFFTRSATSLFPFIFLKGRLVFLSLRSVAFPSPNSFPFGLVFQNPLRPFGNLFFSLDRSFFFDSKDSPFVPCVFFSPPPGLPSSNASSLFVFFVFFLLIPFFPFFLVETIPPLAFPPPPRRVFGVRDELAVPPIFPSFLLL